MIWCHFSAMLGECMHALPVWSCTVPWKLPCSFLGTLACHPQFTPLSPSAPLQPANTSAAQHPTGFRQPSCGGNQGPNGRGSG